MKSSALGLSLIALAVLAQPRDAVANKMHPEQMYRYRPVHGLNANANCRHRLFSICRGCSITIRMRVKQGTACPMNFRSMGPFAGEEIVVRPQHGLYGSANHTATAYQPNPGYVGRDHFETRLFFENGTGRPTAMNLTVNVFVAP